MDCQDASSLRNSAFRLVLSSIQVPPVCKHPGFAALNTSP